MAPVLFLLQHNKSYKNKILVLFYTIKCTKSIAYKLFLSVIFMYILIILLSADINIVLFINNNSSKFLLFL